MLLLLFLKVFCFKWNIKTFSQELVPCGEWGEKKPKYENHIGMLLEVMIHQDGKNQLGTVVVSVGILLLLLKAFCGVLIYEFLLLQFQVGLEPVGYLIAFIQGSFIIIWI